MKSYGAFLWYPTCNLQPVTSNRSPAPGRSIHYQRTNRQLLQLLAPAQKTQLDQESDFTDFASELLDQGRGRGSRATRRQQVIDQKDTAAGFEGVDVHSHRGGAVFQSVILFVSLIGQLAFLSHGNEPGLELVRRRGGKDKAARVDAHHRVDVARFECGSEQVDGARKEPGIGQQRRNILKENAGFWKIGDRADGILDLRQSRGVLGHNNDVVSVTELATF